MLNYEISIVNVVQNEHYFCAVNKTKCCLKVNKLKRFRLCVERVLSMRAFYSYFEVRP